MNSEEFIQTCSSMGYSSKKLAKKYVEKNQKDAYDISWWEQELPTQVEMDSGIKNLERIGNKVDYIITHSPSASVIALLGHGLYEQDVLTRYLEDIRSKVEYKKHFCGHMHVDKAVNEKDIILYEQIIRLA